MKTTTQIEVVHDHADGDTVYQTSSKQQAEITICDICEEELTEKMNIGIEDDFCHKCLDSGGVFRHLKNNFKWRPHEIVEEMEKMKIKRSLIK